MPRWREYHNLMHHHSGRFCVVVFGIPTKLGCTWFTLAVYTRDSTKLAVTSNSSVETAVVRCAHHLCRPAPPPSPRPVRIVPSLSQRWAQLLQLASCALCWLTWPCVGCIVAARSCPDPGRRSWIVGPGPWARGCRGSRQKYRFRGSIIIAHDRH